MKNGFYRASPDLEIPDAPYCTRGLRKYAAGNAQIREATPTETCRMGIPDADGKEQLKQLVFSSDVVGVDLWNDLS